MSTIADELNQLAQTKSAIKNAIIAKGQSVKDTDLFSSYPEKIRAISTGVDTADATAVPADILNGKTAYVKGTKVTGTIPVGSAQLPSISVSSTGLITSAYTLNGAYYSASTKSQNHQISSADDANLIPENIVSGKTIFGVTGTAPAAEEENSLPDRKAAFSRTASIAGGILTIPNVPSLPRFISSPPYYFYTSDDARNVEAAFIFCLCADGAYYGTRFPDSSSIGIIPEFDFVTYNYAGQTLKLAFDPMNNSWINLPSVLVKILP